MTGTFDGESHTGTFDSESHWATVGVLLLQVKQKCSRYRSPLPIINQSAFSHLSLMTRARPGRANRHKIYMRARRAQQNADVLGLAHPSIAAMTSNGDSIFCQPVEPESVLSLDDMFDREMRFLPYGRKPRVLDLCSGTETNKEALTELLYPYRQEFTYVSLESEKKFDCTNSGDIREWRKLLKRYPPGWFDLIFAHPPCTVFSRAKNKVTQEELDDGISIVEAVIECIQHYSPPSWLIENSRGRLHKQPIMQPDANPLMRTATLHLLSYCRYGTWWKKDTHVWSNIEGLQVDRCTSRTPCRWMREGRRHPRSAQAGDCGRRRNGTSREKVYKPPVTLLAILHRRALEQASTIRRKNGR